MRAPLPTAARSWANAARPPAALVELRQPRGEVRLDLRVGRIARAVQELPRIELAVVELLVARLRVAHVRVALGANPLVRAVPPIDRHVLLEQRPRRLDLDDPVRVAAGVTHRRHQRDAVLPPARAS